MQAILGATGAVGKALAAEFGKTGTAFRVVARSEEKLRRDFGKYGDLVEYRAADLQDPRAAGAATKDVDLIFYTVGVPYTDFALHPKLMRTVLDAAADVWRKAVCACEYGLSVRDSADRVCG